jgi:hypothetical protein
VPELLRLSAMLQLVGGAAAPTVQPLLMEALRRAREQGALRLVLRVTVDLEALAASTGSGLLRAR